MSLQTFHTHTRMHPHVISPWFSHMAFGYEKRHNTTKKW